MAKLELSVEEAKAAMEMMKLARPENKNEANLKSGLLNKMKAVIATESLEQKKERARGNIEKIAKAINECLDKYNCELVLAKDELFGTTIEVLDIETGEHTTV